MKRVLRVLTVAAFLLIASTAPSFADGNPWPTCTSTTGGCVLTSK